MLADFITELISKELELIGHVVDHKNTPNWVLYTNGSVVEIGYPCGERTSFESSFKILGRREWPAQSRELGLFTGG